MNYPQAKQLANKFLALLSPACLKIETVGSVKRADFHSVANGVHDLEFLLIPKPGRPPVEFGRPKDVYLTHLDKLLVDLQYQELIRQADDKKDGDRYKKRAIIGTGELNEFCMDLFIVTPATWGLQNLIRTGPSWFSHRTVTNRKSFAWDRTTTPWRQMKGFLPDDIEYIRAKESPDKLSHLKCGDGWLDISDERGVFDIIFGRWIEPSQRREYAES